MTKSEKPEKSFLKRQQNTIRFGLVFQTIRHKLIEHGIEITPYYLMQEGINHVAKIPVIHGNPDEYSFEFLRPEDMKIGAADGGLPEEKSILLLNTGQKCIGLKHNGEVAAYMWINLNEIDFTSLKIPLKSNEAYLWEMRTLESYKGKNLAPYLRFKSYEILKELNREVLYSVSVCFNTPTIRFKKKLNAKKLKLLLYIQLFNKFHRNFTLKSYKNH
jgi:hypothetical protein